MKYWWLKCLCKTDKKRDRRKKEKKSSKDRGKQQLQRRDDVTGRGETQEEARRPGTVRVLPLGRDDEPVSLAAPELLMSPLASVVCHKSVVDLVQVRPLRASLQL